MLIDDTLVEGTFVKESKNRFICTVRIGDSVVECYVPNSSRMGNYLNLERKQVLLSRNQKTGGRTQYSLFAVKHKNKFILLNLNLVNTILQSGPLNELLLLPSNYIVYREKTINGYKADLVLINPKDPGERLIIEAKGIISKRKNVLFPNVFSERGINQLHKIKIMLDQGCKMYYVFVSLSPFVEMIKIDERFDEYSKLLKECVKLGLRLVAVSLKYENNEITIKKNLQVEI
ncbi:DNA/RNA nuclease SfsA [Gorillibacterium sp. CAU 1737]|uniref:DNA/RNA nuclease SfsA n=1 Tax=Gorillibacterium sp. CAU 1737 TaxID=3140362 RepID=UPI0032619FF5